MKQVQEEPFEKEITMTTTTINPAIESWIDTMRPHWLRCAGNIHNDMKFWNECIHDLTPDFWVMIIECYHDLRGETIDRRYSYLNEDLFVIAQRLTKGEPVTIFMNKKGYNKPVFRAVMAMKDIVCNHIGKPMLDQEVQKKRRRPTHEEILRDYEALGAKLKDLFE